MIKEALEYIKSFKREVDLVKIGEQTYATDKLIPIEKELEVVNVATLTGFVELLKDARETKKDYTIHIEDHETVTLKLRTRDEWGTIHTLIKCSAKPFTASINLRDLDTEQFSISLLTKFVQSPMRDELLKICGSTIASQEASIADDGMTQKATTGRAIKTQVAVKNPVVLKPLRTFPEIEQPDEPFVFRISQGRSEVSFSLHASEAAVWKLGCILRIKEYLVEQGHGDFQIAY
jgi:hypothetical protein